MKLISIVTACYNEEENIREIYKQVKQVFNDIHEYTYEHIFIDNSSKDKTVDILRDIAKEDKRVKIIINSRNFGQLRSPYHAMFQTKGDAVIFIVADLQEPPRLIKDFIKKWQEGYKVVIAIKNESEEPPIIFSLRKFYYRLLRKLSEVDIVEQYSGFGLYDKEVVEILKNLNEPYPYFRGLIADIGFESAKIEYVQNKRKKGKSKNNFFTLFDLAMLGMTSYSKIPLRLAVMLGLSSAAISLLVAVVYFVYKILFWSRFSVGIAPLVIGIFFFSSVQLFFLGIVGEYVGSIHTYAQNRPLVIEKERINFD